MLSESMNNAVTRRDTAATALPAETKLTRCVYTVRLHARCKFTRSVARAYRTSGGRVISVLRSFFSPSQRSTIVFFKRNVNVLLTATVYCIFKKLTLPGQSAPLAVLQKQRMNKVPTQHFAGAHLRRHDRQRQTCKTETYMPAKTERAYIRATALAAGFTR